MTVDANASSRKSLPKRAAPGGAAWLEDWTPLAARQASYLVSEMTPQQCEDTLGELSTCEKKLTRRRSVGRSLSAVARRRAC